MLRVSLLAFVISAGCSGGGGPARKIEPKTPDVATADPTMKPPAIEACNTPARHDLMVLDWTPELRTDLEVAMKQGVAMLSYDCKSVRVVECNVEGSYGFIGTTRSEKKIELDDADEVAANLPVGGLTWLSDVGGKLDRSRALLAQLTMIGKRSAGKKQVDSSACQGATHYVQAATIGAFAVAAGSKAELAASLQVMGKGTSGSSKSSTKIEAKAGDLAACEKSDPEAKAPPAECGAVVRVQLEPIAPAAQAAGASEDLAVATCASGFAMSDGKCVKLDKPHQCKPGDEQDCKKQCDAGNAGSCATLAVMLRDGTGATKDEAKAAELGKKACERKAMVGCRVAAATLKNPKARIELLTPACAAGDGKGCVDLGIAQLADKASSGNAQYSFRRACYGGGESEGCAWLGTLYVDGKGGLTKSPKLGAKFLEKGCKDGSAQACYALGQLAKSGKGIPKDATQAKALFEKACKLGHEKACK